MVRDDRVYLEHMLANAERIIRRVQGILRDQFDGDEDLQIVLTHLVQVIGEAARNVSEPMRASIPGVPWKQIVGMRHRLVHDYMNVDLDVLWEVVTKDISPLANALSSFLQSAPKN